MGAGEASVIAAALSEKEIIIATDNMQGRKVAKIFVLPLVGSIEIVVQLYMKKHISKEKAYEALHTLKGEGWFHDFLIEKAMEDIK